MNDQTTSTPIRRTFRQKLAWPGMLFIMIGALIATDAIMVVVATSDPSFAVDPNYGEDGASWTRRQAVQQAGESRGWDIRSELVINTMGQAELRVSLTDEHGQGLDDATIDVTAFHNARAGQPVTFSMLPTADRGRYVAAPNLDRAGRWTFDLDVTVSDIRWTPQLTHDIAEPMNPTAEDGAS